MSEAPLPEPFPSGSDALNLRIAGRFFWMKSATFRWSYNPSCCAFCKSSNSNASAVRERNRSTSALSPRRTAISRRWSQTISKRSVLPIERGSGHDAAFARTSRRYPIARSVLRSAVCAPNEKTNRNPTRQNERGARRYHWPGNVRELENVVERAVILSQGPELEIPLGELKMTPTPKPAPIGPVVAAAASTLESVEREHILRVLEETRWVIAGPGGAAARLGMQRTTLQAKMRKLGISRRSG